MPARLRVTPEEAVRTTAKALVRGALTGILALLWPIFLAQHVTAAPDVCDGLWRARNAIFAKAGYCFSTPEAQALFGKGCFPPFGKLTPDQESVVQRIRDLEATSNCATSSAAEGTAAGNATTVPKYVVELTLSPAATQKLASSGETICIWANYYGTAAPNVPAPEDGEIQLANETTDVTVDALHANLGGISILESDLKKIREPRPLLLINVYTSRKVFQDNLLDCGIYQGEAASAGDVRISCKLIGE